MKNLKKRYPTFNFREITEKDIIYFCRDALSDSGIDPTFYEEEILNIIKSKKWDLEYKDIDGNIILTYPIFNNSIRIVKFLLDYIYDAKVFKEDMNQSFCSCLNIKPKSDEMISFLVKANINQKYKDNMLLQSYFLSSRALNNYYKDSLNNADKLMIGSNFEFVANKLINSEGLVEAFSHYIFKHEMIVDKKIEVLDKIFSKELNDFKKINDSLKGKQEEFERFKLLVKLDYDLKVVKPKNREKLNKI